MNKKTTLLTVMAAFGTLVASAGVGISLTSTNVGPVIGDKIIGYSTQYVSPGDSGTGVTWDLTSMVSAGNDTNNVVSVGSTAQGSNFSNANVAVFIGNQTYNYLKETSNALQNYGQYSPNTALAVYTTPEDLLHYPMNYGTNFSSNWVGSFVLYSLTFKHWGTTTVKADGTGTLKLPNGTFTNVMRVHTFQSWTDSASFLGNPEVFKSKINTYAWYLPGNHLPIAYVQADSLKGNKTAQGSYDQLISTGIEAPEAFENGINLYPNPAKDQVNIGVSMNQTAEVTVRVYDAVGHEVVAPMVKTLYSGYSILTLNVTQLPAGMYFTRIATETEQVTPQRFIVTK